MPISGAVQYSLALSTLPPKKSEILSGQFLVWYPPADHHLSCKPLGGPNLFPLFFSRLPFPPSIFNLSSKASEERREKGERGSARRTERIDPSCHPLLKQESFTECRRFAGVCRGREGGRRPGPTVKEQILFLDLELETQPLPSPPFSLKHINPLRGSLAFFLLQPFLLFIVDRPRLLNSPERKRKKGGEKIRGLSFSFLPFLDDGSLRRRRRRRRRRCTHPREMIAQSGGGSGGRGGEKLR